jgi:ornithine carbamoyltransferase
MISHFLTTTERTRDELIELIESSMTFKGGKDESKPLAGKSAGFFQSFTSHARVNADRCV